MSDSRTDATGESEDVDITTIDGLTTVLERARTDTRIHAGALVAAVALGLVLAWAHWFGLVLGGAFVGLVSPTVARAVAGAVGFGLVVLAAFAVVLGGTTWQVLEMTPVVYVTVGSALGLPALGSLARGVV